MSRIKTFLTHLKEAIKGEDRDYTKGSINLAIFMLAVPMVLEVALESVFAVVDIYFVSKLSNNAVAIVGLTETVLSLVYSIAIGISMSATAMVARRIGEGSRRKASMAAYHAILLGLAVSLVLGISGYFLAESILRWLGASEDMISEGVGCTRIIFAANYSVVFLFVLNGIFRGAGNAAVAMHALWIANGLNIVLDPILIFGLGPIPALGIEGAAIATAVGRSAGVVFQVWVLLKGKSHIRFPKPVLVIRPAILITLVKVSLGGIGQYLINSASWIFLAKIVARFGADTLAGYTIAIRLIIFAIMPSWGIGNAASTLVGQNLGAGQADRANTSVWRAAFINMVFMGLVAIFFFFLATPLVAFFSSDPNVVQAAEDALRIICLGYMFYAYGMVLSMAFNGAGDTRTPTIINFIAFWLMQIPLAYFLAETSTLGPKSVYLAILISETALALMAIYWFRKGYWKRVVI
jgi:putative MATE family efflux protein